MARLALIKQCYLQVVCSLFKHMHTENVDVNKHSPFGGSLSEVLVQLKHTPVSNLRPCRSNRERLILKVRQQIKKLSWNQVVRCLFLMSERWKDNVM